MTIYELQAAQEQAWKSYVDTILECRRLEAASKCAFDKAEKTFKEAYAKQEGDN
jgi:hypothetical protein